MAKYRRKKSRRSHKMTVPMAVAAPVALLAFDVGKDIMSGATNVARAKLTGVTDSGNFNVGLLMRSYGPVLGGVVVHKLAGMAGVNRLIANAKIPLIRV